MLVRGNLALSSVALPQLRIEPGEAVGFRSVREIDLLAAEPLGGSAKVSLRALI